MRKTAFNKRRILFMVIVLLLILLSLSVYSANPGSRPDKSSPNYIKPGYEYVQELVNSIRTKYTGNVQVLKAGTEPDTRDARELVQDVVQLKLRYEKYPRRSEEERYLALIFAGKTEEEPIWKENLEELLEPGPPINWEDILKTFDLKTWEDLFSRKERALAARTEGRVESQKESEEGWSPIWQSRILMPGDKVRTDADSYATIILADDETTITIPPNSVVELTAEMLTIERTTSEKLRLMGGKLIVDVKRFFGKEDDWEITTPNGVIGSRGTKYDISTDGEKTIVRVYEGEVIAISFYDFNTAAVINNDTISIINAGEQGILFSNKSTEVMPLVDAEPLEMVEGEPCKELLTSMVEAMQSADPSTREMLEEGKKKFYEQPRRQKDCVLPPRPEFLFFTNKFLDPSTVNKETFIVLDEENKPVDGFFDVSSSITFIPSRPIFGDIMVTLKGGNKGICSISRVCLEQDYTFRYNGAEKTPDFGSGLPFEITSAIPAIIKNNFVLANLGNTTAENITLTLPTYKTRFPNLFIELKEVSSPPQYTQLRYRVRESGENAFIDFDIPSLRPYEFLPLNITYSALAFGIEYYSRLDVSNFESYDDKELLKTFTRLEEGIEADNPEIASLAQAIVGEEKNPFWKAYKLYNWMATNIGYDYERADRVAEETKKMLAGAKKSGIPPVSALDTLHTKKGICYDYALLYIALARSAGIPSRMVILDVVSEDGEVSGHYIVEIYLPRYGWIPLDPTWGTAFNNFAREEPFQFIDYKEDGITEPIASSLSAINGEGLNLLKSKEVSFIDAQSEEDWETLFQEPFFRELSQLIITSQLRKDLSAFEEYNQVLGQDLFALPGESKTSPAILAEKAVTAYHQGRYEQVQPEVQERIAENINQSLVPFLLNAKTVQEFVVGERAGTTNKSYYDETLFLLSYALSQGDSIRELMAENDYTTAVNSLTAVYYPTRTHLQRYSLNLVATDVYQKLVSSSFFAFGSASLKFWLLIIVFFLLLPAFWFWMMINCLLREKFRHLNKFWWFIIIFFITPAGLIPIGPTLYFFLEYRKRNKPEKRITQWKYSEKR